MIKHGGMRLYDKHYTYMYNLEQGSFFGEYNLMFGLKSNMYYKTHGETHYSMIFRIDSGIFMDAICDDIDSFTHLHNIALQKFRFNSNMIKQINPG